ncbi:porin [Capnocytophaga sp.]|uniref:porin n=1 Tax=Capnocytophaga sp. TaxID=44737 RepID=UPI0026DC967C|nr:porin [Capnocytophaga sp.]MDO5104919.1 porin [Capnocytophaga sp.]
MKKFILYAVLIVPMVVFSQQDLGERLDDVTKKTDKFNAYLNFQSSFDAVSEKGADTRLGFKARQLRLEFRGDITDKIFYRLRHRLNKSNAAADLGNLADATDMMYAGFHLNEKWTLTAGKMCQMWGGFEFDLNPMNIYEYSDFVNAMDNFMVGGMITYMPTENHELIFQITNSRNHSLENVYGTALPAHIKASNSPLAYILNWNGNLFDGKFQTRYAIGLETEAKNTYSTMITLGNRLNLENFQVFLDYMYAKQDLDRLYLSQVKEITTALENVSYNTFILKAEYQPAEKWNLFAKGMYETGNYKSEKVRTSYGYYCGVEFLPFKEQDLRFFLAYIGRTFDYKGGTSHNTNRFSLGMMYRIKAF